MEGSVELAVAVAVEPVAFVLAGGGFDGCNAGEAITPARAKPEEGDVGIRPPRNC